MATKTLARKFGNAVRRLRTAQKMSQEVFAERCGIHRTYKGCIERGEKNVTIETAAKIASALGVPLTKLFSEVDKEL